jgi:signal transduction histidine kinase
MRRICKTALAVALASPAAAALAQTDGELIPVQFPAGDFSRYLTLGLVFLALLALLLWQYHYRRLLRERDRHAAERELNAAALDAVSDGIILWPREAATPTVPKRLAEFLRLPSDTAPVRPRPSATASTDAIERLGGCIARGDRETVVTALRRLREAGTPFDLVCTLADGRRSVALAGSRLSTPAYEAVDRIAFREVTQIFETARAARESRDRLIALLDSLPIPIWSRNSDLALAWCNVAFARAVDANREQAIARNLEFMGGAQASAGKAMARRALAQNAAQTEQKHIVVGGDRRRFDITEQPVAGVGIVGLAVDQTLLDDTRAELARHISAHAEVLESLSTSIVIYGSDGRLKFFNNEYVKQFGLDEEFLAGEPSMGEVLEALRDRRRIPEHADFPSYKRDVVRELLSLINPLEDLMHLPDGSTIRMVAAPHPFGGVIVTYEDVTDTLRVERLYNTLIQVQRETLDHLYEGIAVFGSDGRLKLSNPAYARMWGLAESDFQNEPHVSVIVDRIRGYFPTHLDWSRLRQRIIGRVADRDPRSGRLERNDGSVLVFSSLPLADGGCLYTYLDVTDSTRVERALRERNAALETADRLKSEFIANVSYELRTPLNAIIGFAEILNQAYFGTLNERQAEYSRGILEASNRLLSLINDILDIATIEAGYLQLDLGKVDVQALLSSIETFAAERARNRSLAFTIDCPPGIGTVVADERRLKQAIYNVVSNALKFTPPGGRIAIAARRADGALEISVTDTGIGIDPQDQTIVFEKFAPIRSQGRQTGAGLGLALVKKLIELHHGRVELQSTPGAGTRVTCRIPLHATAHAAS